MQGFLSENVSGGGMNKRHATKNNPPIVADELLGKLALFLSGAMAVMILSLVAGGGQ